MLHRTQMFYIHNQAKLARSFITFVKATIQPTNNIDILLTNAAKMGILALTHSFELRIPCVDS